MVNRIFCYSNEEAKRNGNNASFIKMILQVIGIAVLIPVATFGCIAISDDLMENPMFFLLFAFGFAALAIWYAIKFGLKFSSKLTGFAIDTENNIYYVAKLNNGENFVIGGIAAGRIIDKIVGESGSFAGDLAEGAGAAMSLYTLEQSAKIMQNPEIIAQMVEHADTTTGA